MFKKNIISVSLIFFTLTVASQVLAVNYFYTPNGGQTAPPANALQLLSATNDTLTVQNNATYTTSTHNATSSFIAMDGGTSVTVNSGSTISDTTAAADATINTSTTNIGSQAIINNAGLIASPSFGVAIAQNLGGTEAPFNITNSGTIQTIFFQSPVTNVVDNSGTISCNRTGGSGTGIGIFNGTANITNTGTITAFPQSTNSNAIETATASTISVTLNNNGSIIGGTGTGVAISNQGTNCTFILNAGNGSTISGNYIGNGAGDTFNIVAGSGGSFSLGGNLQNVVTIQAQSGTFNQAGFSITGFNSFSVDGGAIASINGTFNGSTLTNSGTVNMLSDITLSGSGFNNSGVLAPSGSRTLDGNLTETLDGVMAFTLTSPTVYDKLTVTGTQSIDPNSFITVAVNNMGSGIPDGTTFTLFTGNSVPNLPQFNSSGLYTFMPKVVGNTIQVTLTSTISLLQAASQNGATPSVMNLAVAVEQILQNPSLQNTALVQQLLIPLVNLSTTSAITSALNQLIFQQNAVIPTATTNAMVTSNSAQRQLFAFLAQEFQHKKEIVKKWNVKGKKGVQEVLRTKTTPLAMVSPGTTQTQALHQAKPLGYIAGDAFNYKLMYGATLYGSQERQRSRQPYDYPFITKTGGLAFVTQLALTEKYTAGLGLSYASTYCKTYNLGAGSTDPSRIQSYQMTFMNTYLLPEDQISIELDISFAQNKVHQINHIFFGAPPSVGGFGVVDFTVNGDYHSKQSNAQLVVTKNFPITSLDVYFMPTVLFAVNHLNRAQYIDNNPNPPSQIHSGSKITSVLLGFGASVSKDQRNDKNETIVTYEGHIMAFRELHPKPTLEIDQFVGGGPPFIALGIKPFQNTIDLGGSITMPLSANFNFTGAYDLYLKRKYTNNAITLKLNWVH